MKTNVLKIVLPLAVVAVGLTSAASTSSMSRSSKTAIPNGYQHIANPNSCNAVQECNLQTGFNCKIGTNGAQLYDATCVVPLKRSTPN